MKKVNFTKPINKLSKKDVLTAGGKGSSLGEMMHVKIPVPPGFVILTSAYEEFLREKGAGIPKEITKEIKQEFKKLKTKYVAVRSSATAEDSKTASWAGVLETYLNTTDKNLLENVKKCWRSLKASKAVSYMSLKKIKNQKVLVAVVVQKMIQSEVSGIVFTIHPTTGDKNQIVIEAGYGLGESIVGGKIIPDTYIINKNNYKILEKKLFQLGKQKLTDLQIIKLAKLCRKIEKHYGSCQDIEWARENNKFYILQSRPVTSICKTKQKISSLYDYIKSQSWFFGVRAEESLLFYSAKCEGYKQYLKKEYGMEFADALLLPIKKDYPIRVFNRDQAKDFHAISEKKILKNPKILLSFIEKNELLWQDISQQSNNLALALKRNDYVESIKLFKKIFSLYGISSAQFIIIFSLGLKLTENKNNLSGVEKILKKHDVWRNSIAFKEEKMGKNLFYFFKFLMSKEKIKSDPLLLMKFLTLNEVLEWLDKKIKYKGVKRIIDSRKKQGYIYLNLKNEKREIIDNLKEIKTIQNHFLKLSRASEKIKDKDKIFGQIAYGTDKKIRGRVIIIKDKNEIKDKKYLLKNKILVAIQTTPHYIPYMKDVKAIVTDEGGLTCHAAILAREFKKPCLVGTKIATKILKDQDFVEIDMTNSVLRIL